MKTAFKFTFGWVGMIGVVGCASAGPGDVAGGETVGAETSALTYNERVANGTRHDYNGDQNEDIVIYGPTGARLALGKAGGNFTPGSWARSDLNGATQFVAGDFNGDHRSDLIITTGAGSSEWFGTSTGNFTAGSWSRSDLTTGSVRFTVGDFNHDGVSDLMASNDADGIVEYLGKTSGGFDAVWSLYVTMDRIQLTAGDFNGDGASDVLFTVGDGSYLYTGVAGPSGGFNSNVWISHDYALHDVEFTVGNYNGTNIDGRNCDDLIAKTTVETRELLGIANGGFNPPAWVNSAWSLQANVQFVPGDYNGDGKTDLVVSTGAGTTLYLGKSGGGFNTSTWSRSDVDAYHTSFLRGDWSKDGRDDLIITVGTDPKNTPGSYEYLGQASGAQPAGFTNQVWSNSTLGLSSGWLIY